MQIHTQNKYMKYMIGRKDKTFLSYKGNHCAVKTTSL